MKFDKEICIIDIWNMKQFNILGAIPLLLPPIHWSLLTIVVAFVNEAYLHKYIQTFPYVKWDDGTEGPNYVFMEMELQTEQHKDNLWYTKPCSIFWAYVSMKIIISSLEII